MRILLLLLLIHLALGRPHQSYADGDSGLDEKDYEAEPADQAAQAQEGSAQRGEERPQRRLVDYAGNTFPQRAHASPGAAAAASALSRDQNLDYGSNADTNLDETDILANRQKYAGLRSNQRDNVNANRAQVDMYAFESDDQERESDDQESLTVQNDAHSARNILRGRKGSRGEKPKGKCARHPAKQPEDPMKPDTESSPQNTIEGAAMGHHHDINNNGMMNHNVRSMGISNEKENDQDDVVEYEISAPDSNSANIQDAELILKPNDNAFERDEEDISVNYDGNRDRRSAEETLKSSNQEGIDNTKSALPIQEIQGESGTQNGETSEANEQQAIKRHIANLTREQLDELLSSLPADKRELLQEIIGTDKAEVNKRDVTNNNGAQEVPNESEKPSMLETVKASGVGQYTDVNAQDNLAKEVVNTKNNADMYNTKETEENHEEQSTLVDAGNEAVQRTNDDVKLTQKQESDNTEIANDNVKKNEDVKANGLQNSDIDADKSDTKREAKESDYGSPLYESEDMADLSDAKDNEESLVLPNNEMDQDSDQSELNSDIQLSKREVPRNKQLPAKAVLSIADQLQALEDSFPSVRSYDETNQDGLVRVKRNKRENIKRSAAVLSDAKASYIPYRADTEDEDDDEGNEFEDDGFFDRTSNFNMESAQSRAANQETAVQENTSTDGSGIRPDSLNKLPSDGVPEISETEGLDKVSNDKTVVGTDDALRAGEILDVADQPKSTEIRLSESSEPNPIGQDLSGMGSDTDNVLSGSEGADENLMLTSAARSRLSRDSDKDLNHLEEGTDQSFSQLEGGAKRTSEDLQSVENDPNGAFGGLPKNYDGELSRYKRIRRTKQLATAA